MKNLLILLFVFIPVLLYAQWIQQPTGTTNAIRDVEFINRYTGWACGDNKVYKTTNGGDNWFLQTHPTNNLIQGIWPVDSMVVYASGYFNTILKTTDGGENWMALRNGNPPDQPSFEAPYFLNKDTGWICGVDVIFRTTNGGSTFDSIHTFAVQHDIFFRNFNDGVNCGDASVFLKTTNAGLNWFNVQVVNGPGQPNFWRQSFINDTTGWLIGFSGGVYKTTDFGSTWDSIGNVNSSNDIYTVEFADEYNGWCGGQNGVIYRSTDGGESWLQQVTTHQFNNGFIRSIYAYDDSILWAVGNLGKILFTTTGGTTSILQSGNEIPDKFSVEQNYPNPFNPTTKIKFDLPKREFVTLKVYDISGREVAILLNDFKNAGSYIAEFDATHLSSGVYFYTIIAGSFKETKRMVLIK